MLVGFSPRLPRVPPQFADENVPAILNALEVQDFQGGRLVLEGARLSSQLSFSDVLGFDADLFFLVMARSRPPLG